MKAKGPDVNYDGFMGRADDQPEERELRPRLYGTSKGDDVSNMSFYIRRDMLNLLKLCAIAHNTDVQELYNKATEWLFAEYGLGTFIPKEQKKRGPKPKA